MVDQESEQADIVDEHFRPFARALGNLVITFALCEGELLELVTAMVGDEFQAVATLKDRDAKDLVIALLRSQQPPSPDLTELTTGIEDFWRDKQTRNRIIHDHWFPSILEPGTVRTRGITRTRQPEVIFEDRSVEEIWDLARRFQTYDYLFSYWAWAISREGRQDGP